jgi:hypothetical protein
MQAELKHLGSPGHARHRPGGELSAWLLDAALFVLVFSIAAVAVAWTVLLIVT